MSGNLVKTTSVFLPPPVDGLNLVTPPPLMKETEALELNNYYIFDYGIQQICEPELEQTMAEDIVAMFPFEDVAGDEFILIMTATECYRYNVAANTLTAVTRATGFTFNQSSYSIFYFNGNIFISGGGSDNDFPLRYDIAALTLSVTGFTGPAFTSDLLQGCNFKNRAYFVYEGSNTFYYGSIDGISGALTAVDYEATALENGVLLFCTSWAYNQGLSNDELFVLVWANGTVAIFSGSYPDSDDWELIGRAQIPRPIGRNNFIKLGQDVLVGTERGVISLKAVFAGNPGLGSSYFLASRNLGGIRLKNAEIAFNKDFPFMYWAEELPGGTSFATGGIFVLNYERGAWSKIGFTGIGVVTSLAWSGGKFFIADDSLKLYSITDPQADATLGAGADVLYRWKTPYFDLGTNLTKKADFLRLLMRIKDAPTLSARATVYMSVDFKTTEDGFDSSSIAGAADTYTTLELHPPAIGKRFSYLFLAAGADEINEIIGMDVFFETGGAY